MRVRQVLVGVLATSLLAACGIGGQDHCPGGSVRDPGPPTALGDPRPLLLRYVGDEPETAYLNSSAYRLDGDEAVIEVGGETVALPVREDLAVHGCEEPGLAGLRNARFGATFEVDTSSLEVVGAGCNGCM